MNKKFNIKKKMVFIALVVVFIFILLCSFNTTKAAEKYDYIIIGDSRTVGIHQTLTGNYTRNVVKDSVEVNNKEVMFLGAGSQGHSYWFINNYSDITTALDNAQNNAKCIIWLGVNDLYNYSVYAESGNVLASRYPNINFYFYSVTAINSRLWTNVTNSQINNFNTQLINNLRGKSRYNRNLFFENIQNKNITINGTRKTVKKWITDDTSQTRDGLHYNGDLNRAILNQTMLINTDTNGNNTSNTTGMNTDRYTNINIAAVDTGEAREEKQFTDVFDDIATYIPTDEEVSDEINNRVSVILTIITNIGMVIAILILAVSGVKYLIGSVEGTNDYSKDLVPYLIGSALTFGICMIIKILQQIGETINNI